MLGSSASITRDFIRNKSTNPIHLMKPIYVLSLMLISFGSITPPVSGGTMVSENSAAIVVPTHSPYDKGQMEFQAISGVFFSISEDSSNRSTLNNSLTSWRLGWMLNDPSGNGFLRGNCEILVEGFFGSVLEGPGDYLGGGSLQLRYNFVQPDSKWVPYVQIGAGAFYSDISDDQSQNLLDQDWAYNLQAAVGIRRMINHRWALSVEGGYRHVSTADNSDTNTGLDSLGVQIGFSRFF